MSRAHLVPQTRRALAPYWPLPASGSLPTRFFSSSSPLFRSPDRNPPPEPGSYSHQRPLPPPPKRKSHSANQTLSRLLARRRWENQHGGPILRGGKVVGMGLGGVGGSGVSGTRKGRGKMSMKDRLEFGRMAREVSGVESMQNLAEEAVGDALPSGPEPRRRPAPTATPSVSEMRPVASPFAVPDPVESAAQEEKLRKEWAELNRFEDVIKSRQREIKHEERKIKNEEGRKARLERKKKMEEAKAEKNAGDENLEQGTKASRDRGASTRSEKGERNIVAEAEESQKNASEHTSAAVNLPSLPMVSVRHELRDAPLPYFIHRSSSSKTSLYPTVPPTPPSPENSHITFSNTEAVEIAGKYPSSSELREPLENRPSPELEKFMELSKLVGLPVYTDKNKKDGRRWTVVRKVEGSLEEFRKDLQARFPEAQLTLRYTTKQVHIAGVQYALPVKKWLAELGF